MSSLIQKPSVSCKKGPLPLVMSCGDPAGVGPELAVLARAALGKKIPFAWIGDPRHLAPQTMFQEISDPIDIYEVDDTILPVIRHDFPALSQPGKPNPKNAPSIVDVIKRGVEIVQSGQASGIVTAPINKKVLHDDAHFSFPGHTEYLASLAGNATVVMMLASSQLRVVPTTIHIPLSKVPHYFTPSLLEQTIKITHQSLKERFAISFPKIAIAGLNPHAGESGAMGDEEITFMQPLIDRLRKEGFNLQGPLSADTMFHKDAREKYDVAICAYHDQALIAIKTLDFDHGVNITLGLPFIRCSADHGTAFDIAGKGIASANSTIEACKIAWEMAVRSHELTLKK